MLSENLTSDSRIPLTERRMIAMCVKVPAGRRLTCAHCGEIVFADSVALLTRSSLGEPLDPWCRLCTYILMRWATSGAHALDTEFPPEP